MDINLLVMNVGNSRLAMGNFIEGTLGEVTRIAHGQRDDWEQIIGENWKRIENADSPAIIAAGVNPPIVAELEKVVEKVCGRRILWVGKEIEIPINVYTDAPLKTGIDRVLNVAAAFEQMGKACVVVDAGTAMTIDCCNDNGDFIGGAILPGAAMMLEALHERLAAKLPRVELKRPEGAYGKSTSEAILHGVYHGLRGAVKEVVENYATELGIWPELIATGGDADLLFGGWELAHAVSPDLTLYGIALAYTEHHIRNT